VLPNKSNKLLLNPHLKFNQIKRGNIFILNYLPQKRGNIFDLQKIASRVWQKNSFVKNYHKK
jgi:hypothetical protein